MRVSEVRCRVPRFTTRKGGNRRDPDPGGVPSRSAHPRTEDEHEQSVLVPNCTMAELLRLVRQVHFAAARSLVLWLSAFRCRRSCWRARRFGAN